MIPDTKMKDGNTYFIQRNKLLSAILELNETDKTQYLEENKILLFGNIETPKDDKKVYWQREREYILNWTI